MRYFLSALVLLMCIVGCKTNKTNDDQNNVQFAKIDVDSKFYYDFYMTPNSTTNSPLFVCLTGYNPNTGGNDETYCNMLAKYLNKYKLDGIIISPYVYYVGDFTENFSKIKSTIDRIPHDKNRLYIIGGSMGGVQAINYSYKWNVSAIIALAAGCPISDKISPSMKGGPNYKFGETNDFKDVSMCLINGCYPQIYDEDGKVYLSDKVVWVNPTINLSKMMNASQYNDKMKYFNILKFGKEYDHSYILMKETCPLNDEFYFTWLYTRKLK